MNRLPAVVLSAGVLLAACSRPAVRPVLVVPSGDITVAADSSGDCLTIGAAVAAARDGNVIVVRPGLYREQVKIVGKRRLSIVGVDPATTIVDATGHYAAVEVRTDSNRVAGLTLRNADEHGVWVRDGNQVIEHCLITACGDRGIYLSAMAGFAFARIEHCTIVANGGSGIYAARDDARTAVRWNIIADNPRGIVTDDNEGKLVVEGNCLRSGEVDFDRVTPGSDNILADPVFVDRATGDYLLARGSPCRSRAPDGTNLGCF